MPYVVQTLANELQDMGNDVIILVGKGNIKTNIHVVECGFNERMKHALVSNAVKKIFELKPDIFHSHYYPMDFCGALVSSKTNYVMHVHGVLDKQYRTNNLKVQLDCLRGTLSEVIGIKIL